MTTRDSDGRQLAAMRNEILRRRVRTLRLLQASAAG
jgi:hypothetical protein